MTSIAIWAATEQVDIPLSFIRSLVGRIEWASNTDTLLRPFTRCLIDLLNYEGRAHNLAHPSMARHVRALRWLLTHATQGRLATTAVIDADAAQASRIVYATSDASISKAPTGEAALSFRVGSLSPQRRELDRASLSGQGAIGLLELTGILATAVSYGKVLPGALLRCGSDNGGVVYWANAGRSGREHACDILKVLAVALERDGLDVCATWLTRAANHVCDRAAAPRAEALAALPQLELGSAHGSLAELLKSLAPEAEWDTDVWSTSP